MACVLCIDADSSAAEVMRRVLVPLEHEVRFARSVVAGLGEIDKLRPDVVAIDADLYEAARPILEASLRRDDRSVSLLLLAPFDQASDAGDGLEESPYRYLTKPLRDETVRICVAAVLEIDQLRRSSLQLAPKPTDPKPMSQASVSHFASTAGAISLDPSLKLRDLERWAIAEALRRTRGHRRRAAELLGITDRTLRNKLNLSRLHKDRSDWSSS